MEYLKKIKKSLKQIFKDKFKNLNILLKEEEILVFLDTFNNKKFNRDFAKNIFEKISTKKIPLNSINFIKYYLKIYEIFQFKIKEFEVEIDNKADKIHKLKQLEKSHKKIYKIQLSNIILSITEQIKYSDLKEYFKFCIIECSLNNIKDYINCRMIYKHDSILSSITIYPTQIEIDDDIIIYYKKEPAVNKINLNFTIKNILDNTVVHRFNISINEINAFNKNFYELNKIKSNFLIESSLTEMSDAEINKESRRLNDNLKLVYEEKNKFEKWNSELIQPFKKYFKDNNIILFSKNNLLRDSDTLVNESRNFSYNEGNEVINKKVVPITVKLSILITVIVFFISLLSSGYRNTFVEQFVVLTFLGNFIIWRQFNTILSLKLILFLIYTIIMDIYWILVYIRHIYDISIEGEYLKNYKFWCEICVVINIILKCGLCLLYFKLGQDGIDFSAIDNKDNLDISYNGVAFELYTINPNKEEPV